MTHKNSSKKSDTVIFGKHSVIAALNNPKRKIINLYATKESWSEISPQIKNLKCELNFLNKNEFDRLVPAGSVHQNLILQVEALKQPLIEDIIIQDELRDYSLIIVLDQVSDPHNIGAILRSCAAFSASAVILPDHNSPKENNTIAKCSAGAIEHIPLISVTNISQTIKTLKESGYWVVGLDGNTDKTLNNQLFSSKMVIILGSEEKGMRKLTKENCDFIAKIPMSSKVESLNVSNAATIALYEYSKFRDKN